MAPEYNSRLGTFRAYHLAGIIFISSFMSGYDSGVAGGVLTMKPFQSEYHYTAKQKNTVNSLTVGLSQLGSFVTCFFVWPLANKFGRKKVILAGAAIFMIGAIIQTITTRSLAAWYVGRFVSGIGQGFLSVVVPMYSSEMTPKEIRGRCGSYYQWMYTWGVLLSYWVCATSCRSSPDPFIRKANVHQIDYGVAQGGLKTNSEWQIPIGLQLMSSGLLFLGMFTLPESTRWLLTQNRSEDAWKALTWIRGDSGDKTTAEFNDFKIGLQAEAVAKVDFSIRELWDSRNRLRFFLGAMLFTFQNTTGSSALAVFAPQFFS